jgi:hypothetical protein
MTVDSKSNADLQQEVRERETWFHFFAANREIYSLANKGFLDEHLTQNGLTLDIPSLNKAYEALKPTGKLHIIRLEDQPRRIEEETPATTTVQASGGDAQLPTNMPTRSQLRAMSGPEFTAACKKYGEKNCVRVYHSKGEK